MQLLNPQYAQWLCWTSMANRETVMDNHAHAQYFVSLQRKECDQGCDAPRHNWCFRFLRELAIVQKPFTDLRLAIAAGMPSYPFSFSVSISALFARNFK